MDPAVSMTSTGADLALAAGVGDTAPVYDVTGEVDPTSGAVVGTVEATLPVRPEVFEVHLRYFAGLPDFEAQAELCPSRSTEGRPQRRNATRSSRCPFQRATKTS